MSRSYRLAQIVACVALLVSFGAWISIRRTGSGQGVFVLGWLALVGAIIIAKLSRSHDD